MRLSDEGVFSKFSKVIREMNEDKAVERVKRRMEINDGHRPDPGDKIEIVEADIFSYELEAIVNPVNCVGVMGKGLALKFRKKFPEIYTPYRKACNLGHLEMGKVQIIQVNSSKIRYVVNFPTKKHPSMRSSLRGISQGLDELVRKVDKYQIESIGIPALGCGLGGLRWKVVRPVLREKMNPLVASGVQVVVFAPTYKGIRA